MMPDELHYFFLTQTIAFDELIVRIFSIETFAKRVRAFREEMEGGCAIT